MVLLVKQSYCLCNSSFNGKVQLEPGTCCLQKYHIRVMMYNAVNSAGGFRHGESPETGAVRMQVPLSCEGRMFEPSFSKPGEWALQRSSEDWSKELLQEGQMVLLKARMGEGSRERSWHSTDGAHREDSRTGKGRGDYDGEDLMWQGERGGREDRNYKALELFGLSLL